MVELIYLAPDEQLPDFADLDRWLAIEANDEGSFYGTGRSLRPTGENVYYRSLFEDDVSLEQAVAAAQKWAKRFCVPKIWIQREPWKLESEET